MENIYFKKAQEYAKNKNGCLLSDKYKNARSNLEWKCDNPEHPTWVRSYNTISYCNSWCPRCQKEKTHPLKNTNGLTQAQQHALLKNGQCLSTIYINNSNKMEWKCSVPAHSSWFACYSNTVNSGCWCPDCGRDSMISKLTLKNGLKKAQEYARKKRGECLSTEYTKAKNKMEWKCSHIEHGSWFSTYDNVVNNGYWCPECGEDKNTQEYKARKILNYIFDTKFIKRKNLAWNTNPKTNRFLELDGYSENLNIAFEFQGSQHIKPSYNEGIKGLEKIQYRDFIKKENCKIKGIKLIVINELPRKQTGNYIIFFENIINSIKNENIILSKKIDLSIIDKICKSSPKNSRQKIMFKKSLMFAENKGGKCLSTNYINNSNDMIWRCSHSDHSAWLASYNSVSRGSWCPVCANISCSVKNRLKNGLELAKKYAISNGGICLSSEYIGTQDHLEWKCKNQDHPSWHSDFEHVVRRNRWCRKCKIDKNN